MKQLLILIALCTFSVYGLSQNLTLDFEATGRFTSIDEVLIENQTQGTQTTIQGGESILLKSGTTTAITQEEAVNQETIVYPNPNIGNLTCTFFACSDGQTNISLLNMDGKLICSNQANLDRGIYSFTIVDIPSGLFVLNIQGSNYSTSKTIISNSVQKNINPIIEKPARIPNNPGTDNIAGAILKSSPQNEMIFSSGDELKITGFNGSQASIPEEISPTSDMTIQLFFASLPNVTTYDITNITVNSATTGGEVMDNGGELTESGLIWSTESGLTIDNYQGKFIVTNADNPFSNNIPDLYYATTLSLRSSVACTRLVLEAMLN